MPGLAFRSSTKSSSENMRRVVVLAIATSAAARDGASHFASPRGRMKNGKFVLDGPPNRPSLGAAAVTAVEAAGTVDGAARAAVPPSSAMDAARARHADPQCTVAVFGASGRTGTEVVLHRGVALLCRLPVPLHGFYPVLA